VGDILRQEKVGTFRRGLRLATRVRWVRLQPLAFQSDIAKLPDLLKKMQGSVAAAYAGSTMEKLSQSVLPSNANGNSR
jgi:hypothetical protein